MVEGEGEREEGDNREEEKEKKKTEVVTVLEKEKTKRLILSGFLPSPLSLFPFLSHFFFLPFSFFLLPSSFFLRKKPPRNSFKMLGKPLA